MSRTSAFGLLALLLAASAAALVLVPGLALEVDTLLLAGVGAIVLAVGYERYLQAKRTERSTFDVEDVDHRPPILTPGDTLDDRWDDYRFEAIAATVLVSARGCTRAEADDLLETGAWTDDPVAAAYFSEVVEAPRQRTRPWLPLGLRRADRTTQRVHAVAALADLAGVDTEAST